MQTFNEACDTISREAHSTKTYNKYRLQLQVYHRIREHHRLPAQLAIRAISKVVESYRVERQHLHSFNPRGSIVYDQRIMSFKGLDKVSLTTTEGRETIPLTIGDYTGLEKRCSVGRLI